MEPQQSEVHALSFYETVVFLRFWLCFSPAASRVQPPSSQLLLRCPLATVGPGELLFVNDEAKLASLEGPEQLDCPENLGSPEHLDSELASKAKKLAGLHIPANWEVKEVGPANWEAKEAHHPLKSCVFMV